MTKEHWQATLQENTATLFNSYDNGHRYDSVGVCTSCFSFLKITVVEHASYEEFWPMETIWCADL